MTRVVSSVRKPAGVRRGRKKAISQGSSLRPNTHVAVAEGFSKILTANDKAINMTYNR